MQKIAVDWLCAERHVACGYEGDETCTFWQCCALMTGTSLEEWVSRKAERPMWQLVQVVHGRNAPAEQRQKQDQDRTSLREG
jgi:hypothetical protein